VARHAPDGQKRARREGGEGKQKSARIGAIMAALFLGSANALAGPWEDGMVAYNRGDDVPPIRLFRPLAP
jgi:hypothetical protein